MLHCIQRESAQSLMFLVHFIFVEHVCFMKFVLNGGIVGRRFLCAVTQCVFLRSQTATPLCVLAFSRKKTSYRS